MKKELLTIFNKIENNETLTSVEMAAMINYSICDNHQDKMESMKSISTSCLLNRYCQFRCNNESLVCCKCYAEAQLNRQPNTRNKLARNTAFYTNYRITPESVPMINAGVFRFEAFGDVSELLQVENYYTIAEKNPHCTFTAWTKNPQLYQDARQKPKNFILIYSSPLINPEMSKELFQDFIKRFPVVDKIFCVYTKDYAKENHININCGGKHCINCLSCYKKNTRKIINELLK